MDTRESIGCHLYEPSCSFYVVVRPLQVHEHHQRARAS